MTSYGYLVLEVPGLDAPLNSPVPAGEGYVGEWGEVVGGVVGVSWPLVTRPVAVDAVCCAILTKRLMCSGGSCGGWSSIAKTSDRAPRAKKVP